ncbi:sugar transferase [Halochromatium glycolicum]|uniref:Bacterial sugar transferase domain-containing protein n=1 Tax=Halochromatium glycolicum TaxID=85075 RepID=A0AAJ0U106_9GAMM|nr:sugar transferase [Halochromatium glycolicum]MBK1703172.1 hypothetical protein [Halochromatium glycolicum]
MYKLHRRFLLIIAYQIYEVLLILAAIVSSLYLTTDHHALTPLVDVRALALVAIVMLAWHLSLVNSGAYRSRRLERPIAEFARLLRSTFLATGAVATAGVIMDVKFLSGEFVWLFWAMLALLALGSRLVLRVFLSQLRAHNHNIRHVIVVGAGDRGFRFAQTVKRQPEIGYRVVGFVDTSPDVISEKLLGQSISYLGDIKELSSILAQHSVDEVYLTLPIKSCYEEIENVLVRCEEQGIPVTLATDFFDIDSLKMRVEHRFQLPTITLYNGPNIDWQLSVKRLIDVIVSFSVLVAMSPVLLLIALAVKMSSPGPVLFVQDRVGRNKRIFRMYKFRTMVENAEALQVELEGANELVGPAFKIQNDPRVTRLGRFLRSTSLDELPQLVNVLRGDMSLVGPRPLPVRDVVLFSEHSHRRRFSFPPGLTCTWQISGRSGISFERWMEMDMEYIDGWSLARDFAILLGTIPAVLLRRGAY